MGVSTPHDEKETQYVSILHIREAAYGDSLVGISRFPGLPFMEAGLVTVVHHDS